MPIAFLRRRLQSLLVPASLGMMLALVSGGGAVAQDADQELFDGAGCYIQLDDGVVIVVNRLLRRIQLPVGRRERGESPRQTAYRETLEETGIEVDVGKTLFTLAGGGVHLFSCAPLVEVRAEDYADLRARDRLEVSEVLVVDPRTMVNYDGRTIELPWRFPVMRWMVRVLFTLRAGEGLL